MFAARVAGSLLAGLRLAFADFEHHEKDAQGLLRLLH